MVRSAEQLKALEAAIDDCSDRVTDRGQAIKLGNNIGERQADAQIARALEHMGDKATTSADAANLKQLSHNYKQGDRTSRDRIIQGLSRTMLTYTLVGIASTLALSCALIGVPVVVMAGNGQWIDGTQIANEAGYTLYTDTNDNGLVDTMQDFDTSGQALGAAEKMSNTDSISSFLSALFG